MDVPVAVTLDPHSNVTREMARLANSITAFRTSPHVDQYETALRAASSFDPLYRRSGEAAREEPFVPRRALRVLVAEDNAVNRKVTAKILEKAGHSVAVAATGRQALELLAEREFAVVLMDIQMPEMGGLEATMVIRQQEAGTGRRIPIIAMTTHSTSLTPPMTSCLNGRSAGVTRQVSR